MAPVKVGDLFPHDDVVAQWVFSLTAVAEDLAITEAAFQAVLHGGDGPLWTGYHYRQVIARLYEAERPILTANQQPDVQGFLASVPAARGPLDFLLSMYVAPEGARSKIRDRFGGTRHRTVHHSWAGSPELREALEDAAEEDARILVNHEARWLHFEWPEAVALRSLEGDLTDPAANADFRSRVELVQLILRRYVQLTKAVLSAHCARRGVDPTALVVNVEDEDSSGLPDQAEPDGPL